MPAPPELGSRLVVAVARQLSDRRAPRRVRRRRAAAVLADTLPRREPHPPLDGVIEADLCIVGGGYTGLWAALYAKERQPERERRAARGDPLRRRRQRAQRRLPAIVADARARERRVRFPDEIAHDRAARRRATTTSWAPTSSATGSTPSSSRPASSIVAVSTAPARGPATTRRDAARQSSASGPNCSTETQVRAEVALAAVSRRAVAADRRAIVTRRSSPTACAQAAARRRRADLRAQPGARAARARATASSLIDRRGRRARAAGCCWRPAPTRRSCRRCGRYVAPVYDYALMTEPLDAQPARLDRLEARARESATAATSSTTTG